MSDIADLLDFIRAMHDVDCTHLRSEPVSVRVEGKAWVGVVEVFDCTGESMPVYAWAEERDDGREQYVSVLGKPPITSARDAVQVYLTTQQLPTASP